MPKDLDLKPDRYRVQGRSGRWLQRDDFRAMFLILFPGLAVWAGYAWWHRAEISTVLLVSSIGFACLLAGIGIGAWLKRFD
jgi:hypothetical protein